MKHLIIIFLIFSVEFVYSQKSVDEIFSSLPNGENMICNKYGKLAHYIIKQGNSVTEYAEFYGNGNLKSFGTYKNGKKHGIYVEYFKTGELSIIEKYDDKGLIELFQFSVFKDTTKSVVYWKRESPYTDSITVEPIEQYQIFKYLYYNAYYDKTGNILFEGYTYNRNKTGEWIYNLKEQGGIDTIINYDKQFYQKPIFPESFENITPARYDTLWNCDCEDYKSTRKKTFETGIGMFFGYTFPADYSKNYFPSSPSGGFSIELSYSDFFLFGRYFAIGGGAIKSDYDNSELFKKGNYIANDFREISLGYCVLDNNVDRLIPFFGYSKIKSEIDDSVKNIQTISQGVPVFGLVYDKKKLLPKGEDKIGIKKEYRTLFRASLIIAPYNYESGPNGFLINLNIGFSLNNQFYK